MLEKADLVTLEVMAGLSEKQWCTNDENKQIRDAIAAGNPPPFECVEDASGSYSKVLHTDLSEAEKDRILQLLLLKRMTSIRRWIVGIALLLILIMWVVLMTAS
ncbi:MAG: hypothetical protein GX153_08585 [Clostridiaceae bacterium]|nr:hypothetical protein [Clostridiaceae bacterium]